MNMVTVQAPAKVNLALHVLGRRPDGHHDIDSLAVFPRLFDRLVLEPANNRLTLTVQGPWADGVPADTTNLVVKAARLLQDDIGRPDLGTGIILTKDIPHPSGLGGGSADAAATLRGLCDLWSLNMSDEALMPIAEKVGADVPVCLKGCPSRMEGKGNRITTVDWPMATEPVLALINPRVPIPTDPVFAELRHRKNDPLPDLPPSGFDSIKTLLQWLEETRNDLEEPAQRFAPVIGDVLTALRNTSQCALARMSGSGATCFGLYPEPRFAWKATHTIRDAHPDWWFAWAPLSGEDAIVMS